jgi:hypothetical protein
LAAVFLQLAEEDHEAARELHQGGRFRQAMSCCIQAMEKYVRHGIFEMVGADERDAQGASYRERAQTHNLDALIDILLEVYTEHIPDERVREHVRGQFEQVVLQGVRFGRLHNDVRYPRYAQRSRDYTLVNYSGRDVVRLLEKVDRLKRFILDFRLWSGQHQQTAPLELQTPPETSKPLDELDAGLFGLFGNARTGDPPR